jgi:hypothetical protein
LINVQVRIYKLKLNAQFKCYGSVKPINCGRCIKNYQLLKIKLKQSCLKRDFLEKIKEQTESGAGLKKTKLVH